MSRRRLEGFTLTEVLVVIGIILVLAAIALPVIDTVIENTEIAAAKTHLASLKTALASYQQQVGFFPREETTGTPKVGFQMSDNNPNGLLFKLNKAVNFEYADKNVEDGKLVDPWGNPYYYRNRRDGDDDEWDDGLDLSTMPLVFSYGPDGPPGGTGSYAFVEQPSDDMVTADME